MTSIGDYAFYDYDSLESITIPDGVVSIGVGAFFGCSSLKCVTVPESIINIGEDAFYSEVSLFVICGSYTESYAINNNLSYKIRPHTKWQYLDGASDEKGGIKYVECDKCGYTESHEIVPVDLCYKVGEDYAIIDDYTGSQNYIIIPSKISDWIVTEIENYAFQFRKVISKITLPETIKRIGVYAFDGCNKLKEIIIPNSTEIIGSGAFSNCTRLSSVVIGTGILKIESFAFEECANLETVVINGFPTEIGEDAFYGCDNVTVKSDSLYVSEYCGNNTVKFESLYDLGDSNCDGKVDVLDLIRTKKQALGSSTQTASADVNGDCTINALDLISLRRQILGIE